MKQLWTSKFYVCDMFVSSLELSPAYYFSLSLPLIKIQVWLLPGWLG
jgi:hypothetical protein